MILDLLENLVQDWNLQHYQPMLEADVAGWLLHTALCSHHHLRKGEQMHLDSRVLDAPRQRFDFVVGELCTLDGQRPCISPRLVCEIKLFPSSGFTDQQHRVHFEHILNDDIRKLAGLSIQISERCSLIVDACGYLNGQYHRANRREFVKQYRDKTANGLKLILLIYQDNAWHLEEM